MNMSLRRAVVTAAFLAGAASTAMLILPTSVSAQDYGGAPAASPQLDRAPPPARAAAGKPEAKPTIGVKVGKPLIEAQKAFNAAAGAGANADYAPALAKAQEADAVTPKTPFEEYNVAKVLGLIYVRTSQFDQALAQFNRAIATGAMPPEDKVSMMRPAMLLAFNAKDYKKAVAYGSELAATEPLDDQAELVMIQAYYFGDDYAGAEKFGNGLIAAKKAAGKKPAKEMLQTLINAQVKNNNQAGAHQTLEQLVLVEPTPENWGRVIDYAFAGNITDHQALNLYRLRSLTKAMTAQDYLAMASVDLKLGLPAEAKDTLQKGIAAGVLTEAQAKELMTQANTLLPKDQASLPQLEKVAIAAKDGEADVKLGESYWAYGRAAEGEAAIKRGIMKGGVKDMADAQMTLGIVLLSQGKKDEAAQAFQQAGQTASAQGAARVWTLYAQS